MADCPHLWLKLHWDYTHTHSEIYIWYIFIYIYIYIYVEGRDGERGRGGSTRLDWLLADCWLAVVLWDVVQTSSLMSVDTRQTQAQRNTHTHTHSQPYSEKEREGERTARTHGQGNTEINFFLMSICCTDEQGTTNPKSWLPGIKHARSYHCRKL